MFYVITIILYLILYFRIIKCSRYFDNHLINDSLKFDECRVSLLKKWRMRKKTVNTNHEKLDSGYLYQYLVRKSLTRILLHESGCRLDWVFQASFKCIYIYTKLKDLWNNCMMFVLYFWFWKRGSQRCWYFIFNKNKLFYTIDCW